MTKLNVPVDGPHRRCAGPDAAEQFLASLFDRLWIRYRERVSYVKTYEELLQQYHAHFHNDHIAFRTIAWQQPMTGIAVLGRLFECLGYRAAGTYWFDDKHLAAVHYQHPNGMLPKLFISELQTWRLPASILPVFQRSLEAHRPLPSVELLAALCRLEEQTSLQQAELLETVLSFIEQLPWPPPRKDDLLAVHQSSQYGAWVLVHGYNVNHFTSLINSHGVPELDDIEKTAELLRKSGVPMKEEIEGERGSILRQTATAAVVCDVTVTDGGQETTVPWTYAYFELAERGSVRDPATGQSVRFEGFLGPQATHLFEMTRPR
ncbi:MAG: DUF1338 domain-containing protein [Pirellulaceae bacterium]|nr:MAG: DUF1338 domain-containing protein [Pirellulaceae bacterium]